MFNYILLIFLIILSVFLLLLIIKPNIFDCFLGSDEEFDIFERFKFFLLLLVSLYLIYDIYNETFPPADVERDGYVYVLSDEPEEDIEVHGHRYVLKDGEN